MKVAAVNSAGKTIAEGSEQFLYIYLSLMLCIFSILLLANGDKKTVKPEALQKPKVLTAPQGAQELIVDLPFTLFSSEDNEIQEGAFLNIIALMKGHDINAEVRLPSISTSPENAFAQALSLQQRLWREGIVPSDVRVKIFNSKAADETPYLILYNEERAKL